MANGGFCFVAICISIAEKAFTAYPHSWVFGMLKSPLRILDL
jgi:hypothetical protein